MSSPEFLRNRRDELSLEEIGAFHARWYEPEQVTAGPFHSTAELAEYMRLHGLPRPFDLLTTIGV